jgi:hypothetical protein
MHYCSGMPKSPFTAKKSRSPPRRAAVQVSPRQARDRSSLHDLPKSSSATGNLGARDARPLILPDAHCWVRNVRVVNPDSGPFVGGVFNTIDGLVIESARPVDKQNCAGHHGVTLGGADNLRVSRRKPIRTENGSRPSRPRNSDRRTFTKRSFSGGWRNKRTNNVRRQSLPFVSKGARSLLVHAFLQFFARGANAQRWRVRKVQSDGLFSLNLQGICPNLRTPSREINIKNPTPSRPITAAVHKLAHGR